ncbi:penicillin-binding transpeptidase domain-containing protein [Paenibacillus larvae]|nr:penicillin-binding transpeptidase domain-containing protein [Paenibacillus larvae]MDT2277020.1 penicillin-binding transpeptidase domain-containing protein [Paenibacillus larvae]
MPERDIEYATMSFGQGPITTTAIQQLTAYAAIVNGGKLMQPHIIKDIVDPKTGQPVQSFEPVLKGEPISAETSKKRENTWSRLCLIKKLEQAGTYIWTITG